MRGQIDVVVRLRAPLERAVAVLIEDPGVAFEPRRSAAARHDRRFSCRLSFDALEGADLGHEAVVELGNPVRTAGAVSFELHVRPAGHRRLVPVFDGLLEARPDGPGCQLVLTGRYQVPLGVLGRVGDALVGHRRAEQSLERLVTEVADRLETEVERRNASVSRHPATAPEREPRESDYYLG